MITVNTVPANFLIFLFRTPLMEEMSKSFTIERRWNGKALSFVDCNDWRGADFGEFDDNEERLVIDLFRDYNSFIRPVQNVSSPPVTVDFGVALILLINVDEKNQILQTNVWLTMKWNDFQLRWNPLDYGNITNLHVPPDRVWLPDIVLFNNYSQFSASTRQHFSQASFLIDR
ncbi:Neurotransmitter-gated ion-channel ligand binding domain protein [Dictyocaulus viviparus]|uniref:Neurotransmitter-gated ion-channel ligand binding domain protein n=1 Tax=Dictyocaulus viviparus TaxID=29172 RepID=A0A0D8XT91_DICVI|nr:Neurotransmitter-gated ion-channel ligand binding domain protein [Dictyocaulus viviparus]